VLFVPVILLTISALLPLLISLLFALLLLPLLLVFLSAFLFVTKLTFCWCCPFTNGIVVAIAVYKTSGLQNVRFTKCQVYKTSGLQNVRLQKNIHKCSVLVVGGNPHVMLQPCLQAK